MFVPSVAVALLAVMSPPAAAAKGHEEEQIGQGAGGNGGRVFKDSWNDKEDKDE